MLRTLASAVIVAAVLGTAQAVTYWCPMHPNERATSPIACPVCKMTMVAMPPVKVGEYQMAIEMRAHPAGRGAAGLTLTLLEPDGRRFVGGLDVVHEQPLHVFIVDRTLEFFAHVHPDRLPDGRFGLTLDLPAGEFMVVADFSPTGGVPQTLQRAIVTAKANAMAPPLPPSFGGRANSQSAGGITVSLAGNLAAGKTETMSFAFTDASGRPAADLEPYLGAPAHLFAASADLSDVQHAHPEEPTGGVQRVEFEITPARPGPYKLWLQFQRKGKVFTVPFVIDVR